jgi:hypothetical protein
MRLGFVTAPILLWQKLVYHQQVTSMHASSLSQVKFCLSYRTFPCEFIDDSIKIIRKMGFIWISKTY